MLRLITLILIPLILFTGCEQNLIEKIQEDDIKNGGLSYEFDKLHQLGIEGIAKDKDNKIIFYVAELNEMTRKHIDEGLIGIFGQKFDFILRDSKELNIDFSGLKKTEGNLGLNFLLTLPVTLSTTFHKGKINNLQQC